MDVLFSPMGHREPDTHCPVRGGPATEGLEGSSPAPPAFPEGLPEHQGSGRQGWEWEHRGLVSSWGQNLTPTCTPEKHESSPPDSPAPHTWGHHHNLWPSDPFRRISRPPHPLPLAILCSVPRCPSQPGRPWNPGAGF